MGSAGELTANEAFFQRKQAAAVLKHGILQRYPTVFATMTGSSSRGGRVVYLDGYAGPGRYEPELGQTVGAPGSPLLAVQTAAKVEKWSRNVHCVFVERNATYADNLRRVLADEAPESLTYEVLPGGLEDRLADALAIAGDSPLLAFLDPFGTALPYRQMVDGLMNRGDRLKTEVLLNLNLEMVWRIGGYLSGDETDQEKTRTGQSATLARVDDFLGGDWWREKFLQARTSGGEGSAAAAAMSVADEFRRRVTSATGFDSFAVPIRRRPNNPPLFLMILFYRHPTAPYEFNNAVSGANAAWREHFRQADLADELSKREQEPSLFGDDLFVEVSEQEARDVEARLDEEWTKTIAANITQLIAHQPAIKVQDNCTAIYGATLGLAREKHLVKAWKGLAKEGRVEAPDTKLRPRNQTITQFMH